MFDARGGGGIRTLDAGLPHTRFRVERFRPLSHSSVVVVCVASAILALLLYFFQLTMLEVGTTAPDFRLADQDETTHTMQQYRGKWVLIYFYPMDDTPGCTKEACTIAEVYEDFLQLGVTVLGVSKDTPESHRAFRAKYNLPFTLLSDETMEMMTEYGAVTDRTLVGIDLGKSIRRISYLVDPSGVISKVYPNVDPATHATELLQDLRQLTTPAQG